MEFNQNLIQLKVSVLKISLKKIASIIVTGLLLAPSHSMAVLEEIIVPTDKFVGFQVLNYIYTGWPNLDTPLVKYESGFNQFYPSFLPDSISQQWPLIFMDVGPRFSLNRVFVNGARSLSFTLEIIQGEFYCTTGEPFGPPMGEGTYFYQGVTGIQCYTDGGGLTFESAISISNIKLIAEIVEEKPKELAPIDSTLGCAISANSTVNSDTLALHESISLVGVPFNLSYASNRLRPSTDFSPKSLGFGGWTPSLVHHYNSVTKGIYFGDGRYRNVEAAFQNNSYYATNASGSEVYHFNSSGVHTNTKEALTNITKFSFSYDSSGKLIGITDRFNKTTSISYSNGRAIITSPYGQVTELSFDANGFLNSLKNPNNEIFSMVHSSQGYLTSFSKPGGQTSFVTYDSNGYVVKDIGAGGDFISFVRTFDQSTNSQTISMSTALDRKTQYQTSTPAAGSSIHKIISPDGTSSEFSNQDKGSDNSINSIGQTSQSTNVQDPRFGWMAPFAQTSSFGINNSNINLTSQVTKTADLTDSNDPFSFTKLITKTVLQNDSSRTYTSEYLKSTRTLSSTSPLGKVSYTVLNEAGQVGIVQQGTLEPVRLNYDSFGRISRAQQGSRNSYFYYDNLGNLQSVVDPLGRTSQFNSDLSGRVIEQIRPDQKSVKFTYDANGNVTSITPPGRSAHQFSFNLFETVDTYLPPALNGEVSTKYSYNLDKQLTKIQRPDGKSIDFNYSAQSGKLDSVGTSDGNISLGYAPASGQLINIISTDQVISNFSYEGPLLSSNSVQIANAQIKMNYSYAADANLNAVTAIGSDGEQSIVNLVYDKDNMPITIGNEIMSYDLQTGLLVSSSLDLVFENMSRNKYGEIISDSFKFTGNTKRDKDDDNESYCQNKSNIFSYVLARDNAGRIIGKTERFHGDHGKNYSYSFDPVGRLSSARSDGKNIFYQYDSNGNRIKKYEGNRSTTAEYDAQDRLIKYGNQEFIYNQNGDLIAKIEPKNHGHHYGEDDQDDHDRSRKTRRTEYAYDVFGNLKKVSLANGKVIEYLVDGQNRRVAKKVNGQMVQMFLYQSQLQIAAELDGQGKIVRRFIYGTKSNTPDYFIQRGVKYKIVSDHLGSPRLIVNSITGKIISEMNFDEFGIMTEYRSKNKNAMIPFGFAGGLYDADTGLVRFGARDYMPEVGRWVTKDPIGFAAGDTNLYGYTFNDPVNFIDPSGTIGFAGATVGFISGLVGGYASTGSLNAALVGGAVGAVVGFVAPYTSTTAGAAAANFTANILGQFAANYYDTGNPFSQFDPASPFLSTIGGSVGQSVGRCIGATGRVGAAIEGGASGLTERGLAGILGNQPIPLAPLSRGR